MTLARLLARAGVLSKQQLLCEHCDGDPERKKYLGCLAPPIVTYCVNGRPDAEDIWTTERYAQWLEDIDGADAHGPESATWVYNFANTGDIHRHLSGDLWDACPRSYAEFSAPGLRLMADHAIDTARNIQRGVPGAWMLGDAKPSAKFLTLITLCLDVLEDLQRPEPPDADA